MPAVAQGGGAFAAQLHAAQRQAAYLACLKTIGDAQPPVGSAAAQATPAAFVDRLANLLTSDGDTLMLGSSGGQESPPSMPPNSLPPPPPPVWADGGAQPSPHAVATDAAYAAYAAATDALRTAHCPPPTIPSPAAYHHTCAHLHSSGAASTTATPHLAADRLGERLACWGSPAVGGDAWGHEGGASVALALRTGSGGNVRAHPLFVIVGGRSAAEGEGGGGTLVHAFDATRRTWLPVRQTGAAPSRLRAHSLASARGDPARAGECLLVCGGGDGKRISSELYALEIARDPEAPLSLQLPAVAPSAASTAGGLVANLAAAAANAAAAASAGSALGAVVAAWSHPQVRGEAPPPRVGHCAAIMGEAMLIFGGFVPSPAKSGAALGTRRSKSGRRAAAKSSSAADAQGSYSNALYSLHLERSTWSMPTVHCAPGASPPVARVGATATTLHDGEALLFGGSHCGAPTAALDRLIVTSEGGAVATLQVEQPQVSGTSPAARFGHVAALLGHTDVALFGGYGGPGGRVPLGDVALLDMARMLWSVLEFRGVPPAPRAGAVGAVGLGEPRRLWIFGGCAALDARPLNDVHTLDVSRRLDACSTASVGRPAPVIHAEASSASATAAALLPDESPARRELLAGAALDVASAPQLLGAQVTPRPPVRPMLPPPPRAVLVPAHHHLAPALQKRPLRQLPVELAPPPPVRLPPMPPPMPPPTPAVEGLPDAHRVRKGVTTITGAVTITPTPEARRLPASVAAGGVTAKVAADKAAAEAAAIEEPAAEEAAAVAVMAAEGTSAAERAAQAAEAAAAAGAAGLVLFARVARASASAVKQAAVSLADAAASDEAWVPNHDEAAPADDGSEGVTVLVRRDGKYVRVRRPF